MTAPKQKTLLIDFDGVLALYDGSFSAERLGEPHPQALEAVRRYVEAGYRVMVFTSRARDRNGFLAVRDWLAANGFDGLVVPNQMNVTSYKVPAVAYLDDRAWRFDGQTWPDVWHLDRFKPWWDRK